MRIEQIRNFAIQLSSAMKETDRVTECLVKTEVKLATLQVENKELKQDNVRLEKESQSYAKHLSRAARENASFTERMDQAKIQLATTWKELARHKQQEFSLKEQLACDALKMMSDQ